MNAATISSNIYYLGAHDTQTDLFESLWEIPQGISYNCYLILDRHPTLVDTVELKFSDDLLAQLKQLLQNRTLEYLVINHMEPDHSGTIKKVLAAYPQVKIVGNHKTALMAVGFYNLDEDKIKLIRTGDTLNLGKHQLEFYQTSMVHWPESMVTFEKNTGILFSSDIFGGFKTAEPEPLADRINNLDEYLTEARRYFASVLGAYTKPTKRVLKNLASLDIKTIAPAHGLVWQEKKQIILDHYQNWAELKAELGVTIIYGSMYGHTKKIAEKIATEITQANLPVKIIDAARVSLAEQLSSIWQYQGLIIGSCTYVDGLFPPIQRLLAALTTDKINDRFFGFFGSYSWTGGSLKKLKIFADNSKMELVGEPFKTQYQLTVESKKSAIALAQVMIKKLIF